MPVRLEPFYEVRPEKAASACDQYAHQQRLLARLGDTPSCSAPSCMRSRLRPYTLLGVCAHPRFRVSRRLATLSSAAILAALGVVAISNSLTYPTLGGYDAEDYLAYAEQPRRAGELPDAVGAYYTPPGYMALAGVATKLGARLDLDDPARMGQLLNALLVVASGTLVYLLARVLWPGRPVLWFAAVGFFAFFPTVLKTAAMFHPEPLSMAPRRRGAVGARIHGPPRRYTWKLAVPLGILLGAGQLVRAWSLWMLGVTVAVLLVVALTDRSIRRKALVALAVAIALAAVVPSPVVRLSGDAVLEPGVRSATAGCVPARAPTARVLCRRRVPRRRHPAVARPLQRSLRAGLLRGGLG